MLGAEKRAEARVEWKEEEATFASRRRLVADKGRWKSAHMGRQVHVGATVTDGVRSPSVVSRACGRRLVLPVKRWLRLISGPQLNSNFQDFQSFKL
jgi:hypothetical protein